MSGQIDVAKLLISIETTLAQAQRELATARRDVADSSRKMDDSLRTVKEGGNAVRASFAKIGAAVASAFAFGAIRRGTQVLIDNADAVDKAAGALGVAVEQYQIYQQVADLAGIEQEQFNVGLGQFVQKLGEARTGTGTLLPILKQARVALTDQNGAARDSIDVLGDYLEAIRNAADGQQALFLASQAFGLRGGRDFINLAKTGREEIARLGEEFQRTGSILREDTVKELVRAKDEITRLSTTIENKLTTALGHAIAGWRDLLSTLGVREGAPTIQVKIEVGEAEAKIAELKVRLEALRQSGQPSSRIAQAARAGQISDLERQIAAEQARADALRARLEKETAAATPTGAKTPPISITSDTAKKELEDIEKVSRARIDALADQEAAEIAFVERARDRAALATDDKLQQLDEQHRIALRDADRELDDLSRLMEAKQAIESEFAQKRAQLEKELQDKSDKEQKSRIESLSQEFGNSLTTVFFEGEQGIKRLGDAFVRDFIQRSVTAFANSILAKIFVGGALSGNPFVAAAGFILGAGPTPKKAATGADISGSEPRQFIVGEKGMPELLSLGPGVSGRITPLGASASGGGGGIQLNVITTETPENVQVRRLNRGGGRQVLEVIVGEAARSVARPGGVLGRAVLGSTTAGRRLER